MKRVLLERKANLSQADFARDHLQGHGMPVIVTDAMDNWPARSKWTFDYFRATYGSDFATAHHGIYTNSAKVTKLSAYIDYLTHPNTELPGFWINTKDGRPLRTPPEQDSSPPYLLGWYAFQKHPELYEDIKPAPYFVVDWLVALSPVFRDMYDWICGRECYNVFIGPEGSFSKLHQDYCHTHGSLAQIQGRKRVYLFSPADTDFLYDGRVNPEKPDFDQFELFEQATAYEGILEPGELLFMPPDWWHCVRGLDPSITVTHNFFNEVNINQQVTKILQKLPKLIEGFGRIPEWRERLGITWKPDTITPPP